VARLRPFATPAAAVLVTAAATLALPVAPAQAAYCSGGTGVSVLVDFGTLGGGTATGCGGGASVASSAFEKAGFPLTPHPQQRGFVCQVKGEPADGDCMGTTSYWGFFVSDDGKGWVYASQGVYQQAVDSGDSVALVWQSTATQRKPGVAPAPSSGGQESVPTTATTTKKPKPKPSPSPVKPASTAAAASSTPSPTLTTAVTRSTKAKPTAPRATAATSATPPPTPTPSPTTAAASTTTSAPGPSASSSITTATEPTSADDGGGLPGWVAPGLVALLAFAAGGLAWARRAR
jgi:hypothetical protein